MGSVNRRTATAVLMAVATVATALAPMALASPASVAGSPAADGSSRGGALPIPQPLESRRLEIVDQTTFVGPGDTFSLALRLADAGDDATISLTLHQPVTNRIQFGNTLAGDDLGGVVQQTDPLPVRDLPVEPAGTIGPDGEVDERGVVRFRLVVPEADAPGDNPFALRVAEPGVYPLVIALGGGSGGGGSPDDEIVTHVVRPPDATEDSAAAPRPLSVATLVRLDGNVAVSPDGSPEVTPVTAARLADVTRVLARAPVPATVQSTGALLEALAAAEPTAPLADALRSRLLRPTWAPVSITDLLAADQAGFLDRQLLAGSGSATALAGEAGSTTLWVLDAGVDPASLTALVTRGVRGVVVPESLADPLDPNRFPATLTQSFTVTDSNGSAIPALQTDLVLTALLNSSDQPALAANRVLADLAILAFDFPDLPRAAVLDTGREVDPRALQLVLSGLSPDASGPAGTVDLLEGRTVDQALAAAAPVDGGLERPWEAAEPADLGTWPARLATTDADTASLVATLDPTAGDVLAEQTVASVNRLTLASGESGLTTSARDLLLDDATERIADSLAAIGIPAQGTVTLTADTGVVPVTLENGLPDPVKVRLSVLSDKLEFPDGDTLELTLDPGTNRREIAVRTRATGSFPVELDLRTADDRIVVATGRLSVRSTAFSGLGLVLSIVAGVFLAVWWALHLRSARRSRQLIDAAGGTERADG